MSERRKHDYRLNPDYEDGLTADLAQQAGKDMEMIRVRVMVPALPEAEIRQLTTTVELMLEDFGWQPAGLAREYACRNKPGVTRIYIHGMRAKEASHE